MKALILNSGMGKRMGVLTTEHPKCMTEIAKGETILSRQLRLLQKYGIKEVVITTGLFDRALKEYCRSLNLSLRIVFVKNPLYDQTNYIYSIYLARQYLNSNLLLMHGDLVFADEVLQKLIKQPDSCMTVSSTLSLPAKDFKAVLSQNRIIKIGIGFFKDAVAAQPLYKLKYSDWKVWLERIIEFCQQNRVNCYAENAFNEVSSRCQLYSFDVKDQLCSEIDTPEDLAVVKERLAYLDR
ncbi:MAG: NTP transferase domain-containing protein [Firmicutes bacterium]|nr:NTP transferase domain-containing protein [Bacillota bacterium]